MYGNPGRKKTATLRRTAVQETSVSRLHVGAIQSPLKTFQHHNAMYGIEGFNEALNCAASMPRDARHTGGTLLLKLGCAWQKMHGMHDARCRHAGLGVSQ